MNRCHWILSASLVALATLFTAPVSHAGVDIFFGVNTPVATDSSLFSSISSRYFDRDERVVDDWGRRYPNPDDLAVFLFVSSHSQETPEAIDDDRGKGMSWYEVGVRAAVPAGAWYVAIDGPAPGRYAKPYGQWSRQQQDPRHVAKFSDREARDLVAVLMAHDYYGVTPQVAMSWRDDGSSVQTIMTREYHNRHTGDGRHQDDHHDR